MCWEEKQCIKTPAQGLQITELSLRNNRLDWISHPFLTMLITLGCLDLTGRIEKRGSLLAMAISLHPSPESAACHAVNAWLLHLYLKASPFNLREGGQGPSLAWLGDSRIIMSQKNTNIINTSNKCAERYSANHLMHTSYVLKYSKAAFLLPQTDDGYLLHLETHRAIQIRFELQIHWNIWTCVSIRNHLAKCAADNQNFCFEKWMLTDSLK